MLSYLLGRLWHALLCVLGVSVIVFAITNLIGDPVNLLLPPEVSSADRQAYREALGLDRDPVTQYLIFLSKAVQGDLGVSYRFNVPVLELVLSRFPATVELALAAIVFAVLVGMSTGIVSAIWPGTLVDRLVQGVSLVGMAAPTFWVGIKLI
jgi:peptide/nickel transport system permease protein